MSVPNPAELLAARERLARRQADEYAARLHAVEEALQDLSSGAHATQSRDYGRGIAYAANYIRTAMAVAGASGARR